VRRRSVWATLASRSLLLILPLLTIAGCEPPRDFPAWNRVTRIEVVETKRPQGVVKEIDDPRQVARIIAFVNANRTGYREPWFGEPLPPIDVNFYERRRYKGHFGVGPEFFEIHRGTITFLSRPASFEEVRQFMELIGLDQSMLWLRS
jgi:hypothetical protein